jgi:hypothetical protein
MGFSGFRFQHGLQAQSRHAAGLARASRSAFRESLAIAAIYPLWPKKEIDGRLAKRSQDAVFSDARISA